MAGKIFVNYRRDDSASHALNVAQYMERAFGARNVFIDVDSIQIGQNFEDVLEERLGQCKVMLAVMGPNWTKVKDESGGNRLDDPQDWVRLELARALKRNIKVIPILVGGASKLPLSAELPDELRPLLKRQSITVTPNGVRYEMAGLANDIRTDLGWHRRGPLWAGLAAAAIVLVVGLAYFAGVRLPATPSATNVPPTATNVASFEAQLNDHCRSLLRTMRSASAIAAFAIAGNGACGSSAGQPQLRDARNAAMTACAQQGTDCRVVELVEGDWSLNPDCEKKYAEWKTAYPVKVFAVAKSGFCYITTSQKQLEDARTAALAECERLSGNCRVHDVDQGNWELSPECKADQAKWQTMEPARAFAAARNGACGWGQGYISPDAASKGALEACAQNGTECRITDNFDGNWQVAGDCKDLVAKWAKLGGRGAFAVGMSGACGYSYSFSTTNQADEEAMNQCQKNQGYDCKIVGRK